MVDRSLIPESLQVLRDEEQFDYCVDITAVHYPKPLHRQPADAHCADAAACPASLAAADEVLSLPMSPDLADADFDRIVPALAGAVGPRAR